jgi:DNA-binding CsgD family transcriptional regulator
VNCPHCGKELVFIPANFSPKQAELVELLATDPHNLRELGDRLGHGEQVVKNMACRLYKKLGVKNRIELAQLWTTELFRIGVKELATAKFEVAP